MYIRPAWLFVIAVTALMAACQSAPVTGRKQLMLVPESQAIAASKDAYTQTLAPIQKAGKLNDDAALKARVDKITARLVAQAILYRPDTANWDWQVAVIDDPKTLNAWCMAGGRMAIYTGIIQKLNLTDDEIAEVMGHEIAHALAKHTAERMSTAMASEMALQAGVPTKVHILNLLHRLVDGKPLSAPVVDAPQALSLAKEPQANVERYDALRQAREVRHAS